MLCVHLFQIYCSSSKQDLLFTDFCEDSDDIEEGADYNKVYTDLTELKDIIFVFSFN